MRQPTEGNGPHSTIRIFDTLAVFDAVVPPTVYPERPTSSVEGPRPAQQNHETNPMLIWEGFAGRPVLEGWCRLSQNLRNEPIVNLDKICGPSWLVRGFHASGKTTQTNPTLPEWRPDRLRGLVNNGKRTQPCRNGSLSLGSRGEEARERSHRTRIDPGKVRERSHGCTRFRRSCGIQGSRRFWEWAPLGFRSPGTTSRGRPAPNRVERPRHPFPKMLNTLSKRRTPSVYWKRRPGPACIEHGPSKPAATLRGSGYDRPIPRQATTARHSQYPGESGGTAPARRLASATAYTILKPLRILDDRPYLISEADGRPGPPARRGWVGTCGCQAS